MRSRVMPGSSPTMERREPVRRLKSVDLPTLGRPTIAKIGAVAAVKADFFECRLRESFTGSSPKFLLLQSGMKAERPGDGAKALIAGPQECARRKRNRGEKMGIDIADSHSEKRPAINNTQDLIIAGYLDLRQIFKCAENRLTLPQMPQSHFAKNEGVSDDLSIVEQRRKCWIAFAEMVDPDGGVGQDQYLPALRRGIEANLGSVPPRRANLCALSRSMSAFRASRTSAVFSFSPVYACALARSSSSRASVVRIGVS